VEESLFHSIISTNVLENIPGKLLVQLPRNEDHDNGRQCDDGRDGNEIRPDVLPDVVVLGLEGAAVAENTHGILDLVHLDGRVDE
jgi:hypothetical protein